MFGCEHVPDYVCLCRCACATVCYWLGRWVGVQADVHGNVCVCACMHACAMESEEIELPCLILRDVELKFLFLC
jgi:hypothetical protein